MKICFVLPDLGGGGAERVALDLAREFAARGHPVEFWLMRAQGALLAEARQAGFAIRDLAAPRMRHLLPALLSALRQDRPGALIAFMWPLTLIVPLAARLCGFAGRVLVAEHGVVSRQYALRGLGTRLALRPGVWLGYRLADARVAVSDGVAADMAALAALPAGAVRAIANPVRRMAAPDAQGLARANALWPQAEGARLLAVGALKPVKNHALLLRAFALLPDPTLRLMILGAGEGAAALHRLASDLGIAGRVVLAGFHPDPAPFYATADLFVLSSDREGFGNVLVEALAFGLPVVATDCPVGPAEILAHGRWGLLVPPGDAGALAAAITAALARPPDHESLRARAADFAPERAAAAYLELLGVR